VLVQPDLDLPPAERSGPSDDVAWLADRASTLTTARRAALQRLLGGTAAENRDLSLRVRELEAELGRAAAELAQLRRELQGAVHDAMTDPLTGLANRRAFDLELAALGACTRERSPAHLLIADIDHFKRVNDRHGHDLGDVVLRIAAEMFLANVRRDSLIARVGGDEFGILLPEADLPYATAIATRLCELLASRRLTVRGGPEVIDEMTLSIGIAGHHAGEPGWQWYARADTALYQAKRDGRNRTCISRPLDAGL
jgi:diguanylate cyclase